MHKKIWIPLLIIILMILCSYVISWTLISVLLFIPAMVLTYILYLKTYYKNSAKPDRILPLYLLALGIQFIHFTEEYLTDFVTKIPRLMGQDPYPLDYWIVFNMLAYFLFIIGAIIIFKRAVLFMVIPLFFVIAGVLLNAVGHILLSFYVGGYFSGLYSALIYTLIGPVLLIRIINETRVATEPV